jgi:hypothetical protein
VIQERDALAVLRELILEKMAGWNPEEMSRLNR